MTFDHPLVRASLKCPLCAGPKDQALVACWPCFRSWNMRGGNRNADAIIASVEASLFVCEAYAS